MEFKNILSFEKGVFEKDGFETRFDDSFLVKLLNFDIDQSGRPVRRRGYSYWTDLLENASATSGLLPDTSGKTGFGSKIQAIYNWLDIYDEEYVWVVSNKKVYYEFLNSQKTWRCINPSGNIDLEETEKHIDVVSYLGIIFFNDVGHNVYMYNLFNVEAAQGATYIAYFGGDKIYLREYTTGYPAYHGPWDIDAVNTGTKTFTVNGVDLTQFIEADDKVIVEGSTGNDAVYTVDSCSFSTNTSIVVNETIASSTADGTIKSCFRIKIEDAADNLDGKRINDYLEGINYIAPSGGVITSASDLKLGYCLRIETSTDIYHYFVLDNGKNQRATDKCSIIKFTDTFEAVDFTEIDMETTGEIIQFTEYDGYLYLYCEDGKLQKIATDDLTITELTTANGIAELTGITNSSSKKQYAICSKDDGTLYLGSASLPGNAVEDSIFYPHENTTALQSNFSNLSFYNQIQVFDDETYFYTYDTVLTQRSLAGSPSYPVIASAPVGFGSQNSFFDWSTNYLYSVEYQFPHSYIVLQRINRSGLSGYVGSTPTIPSILGWSFVSIAGMIASKTVYEAIYVFATYQKTTFPFTYGSFILCWDSAFNYKGYFDFSSVNVRSYCIGKGSDSLWYMFIAYNAGGVEKLVKYAFLGSWTINNVHEQSTSYPTNYLSAQKGYVFSINTSNEKMQKYQVGTGAADSFLVGVYDLSIPNGYLPRHVAYFAAKKKHYVSYLNGSTSACLQRFDDNFKREFFYDVISSTWSEKGILIDETNDNILFFFYIVSTTYVMKLVYETILEYVVPIGIDGTHSVANKNIFFAVMYGACRKLGRIDFLDTYIYYGFSGVQSGGVDYGGFWKIKDYDDQSFVSANTSCFKSLVEDDYRWLIEGNPDDDGNYANMKFSLTWEYPGGGYLNTDFVHFINFLSNAFYFIFTSSTTAIDPTKDLLQYLGTPKPPTVSLQNATPGTLTVGLKLRYFLSFLFYSGQNTALSNYSEEIEIPDLGSDPQPVKIVLTNLNLQNPAGLDIYNIDDVEKIQIYRQQDSGSGWSLPLLLANIEKNNDDEWFYDPYASPAPPYAAETYEDSVLSIPNNPFTESNILRYAVADMLIHKLRLVLINDLNQSNSNVILFSSFDIAEAIPPGNVRAIESGDGDKLYAGKSVQDYLYLFKEKRIYAILGDVYNGQLIDVNKTIGCKYKNLIGVFSNVIYFMNDLGIWSLSAQQMANITENRLDNYFDRYRDDCIDFDNLDANGYVFVDDDGLEVKWYVPQKQDGVAQTRNNICIVYNIRFNSFRIYEYYNEIFLEKRIKDISENVYKRLITDYSGNIWELTVDKNDDGNPIKYILRTKEFNFNTNVFAKSYKLIKLFGKYLDGCRLTYWIDGKRYAGDLVAENMFGTKNDLLFSIWSEGRANTIMIEISGETSNDFPLVIEELLIGYDRLKSLR